MDHAPSVSISHRLRDGGENRKEPGQSVGRGGTGRQQLGQRFPFHQLHAEEWPAVCECPQLIDRHHAGMLQLAADLSLLHEPTDHVGVFAMAFQEDLDRHVAPEVGIAAFQHRRPCRRERSRHRSDNEAWDRHRLAGGRSARASRRRTCP